MSTARLFHIDAFADAPFVGNPAMICLLPDGRELPDDWMQAIAADINLSETAYLRPLPDGDHALRWFTPANEVELCGHATLASAHALFELGAAGPLRFATLSGVLSVTRDDTGTLWMDFPRRDADPVTNPSLSKALAEALGTPAVTDLARTPSGDLFATLPEEPLIRALQPDFRRIAALPDHRGIIVTARASARSPHDFVSRFFAPNENIDEDPVTGSAHCTLAPHWSEKLNKTQLSGHQCSPRGGTVHCRIDGDRVHLGGRAITIYRGEIDLPAS